MRSLMRGSVEITASLSFDDGRKQGNGTVDQTAKAIQVEVSMTSLHAGACDPWVEGSG